MRSIPPSTASLFAAVVVLAACDSPTDVHRLAARAGSAELAATIGGGATVRIIPPASRDLPVNGSLTLTIRAGGSTSRERLPRPVSQVVWTSTDLARATVEANSGLVRGLSAGPVWIRAELGGALDSVLLNIVTAALPPIAITPAAPSIDSGATVQLSAAVAGTWTSRNALVASVNSTGLVRGVRPGTTEIVLRGARGDSGVARVTVLTVPPPLQPPPPSTVELPRVRLDGLLAEARAAAVSRRINVATAQALQRALDTSRLGDEIVLQAGVTFSGHFRLRKKPEGPGWITIRGANATVPAGTRVRPSTAVGWAKVVSATTSDPPIFADPGAHHYRLTGFEITVPDNQAWANNLLRLGASGPNQDTWAEQPTHLVVDRMYVHGTTTVNLGHCIAVHSAHTVIVDSWLSDCHGKPFDSQAIMGFNGAGPFKIENNYLEGAGENIMFGGMDPTIPNLVPSDIEIRRNHFFKPDSWRGGVWTVKNLLELKLGRRVLIEDNIFENNWTDAQSGTAIVLKSVNQNGTAPWSETSDVTFRFNIIRNVANGLAAAANPERHPTVPMARVYVGYNSFERVGTGDYAGGRLWSLSGVNDMTFEHNSGLGVTHGLLLVSGMGSRLIIRNNIFGTTQANFGSWDYAIHGDRVGRGTVGLNGFYENWSVVNNVMPGITAALFPPSNFTPATLGAIGFANYPAELRLSPTSVYWRASTDGTAIGADYTQLSARTAGVVVAP